MAKSFVLSLNKTLKKDVKMHVGLFLLVVILSFQILGPHEVFAASRTLSKVTGVKYKVKKSGDVQVEIGLSKPAKIKYKRLKSQNLIYVDLYRSKLKRSVKRDMIVSPQAFVKKIQAAQNTKDKVRVVCRLMEGVKYTVGIVSNPTNIVVNLKRKKGKKKRKVAPLRLKKTSPMDSADLVDLARMMDEAQLALEEKKYDQAIRLYGKVLKKPENPFTPEAMEFIGVAREKKGQTARARSEYKKYLRRYPANDGTSRVRDRLKALGKKAARLKLMLNDAKGAFDQGDYGAAIKLFTELLEKGAYREVSLELLGQSYEMNGQSSSAIDEFTRYLQFYPEGPGADRVNARLKALWERDKRAGGKFEEAGKALTGGEYERSARMYKSLLSSEKHKKQSLEFLGLSYEKGGKLERAVSVYKEYLQLYPKEEGSSRVRQRLAGLQTAKVAPKKKLKKVKKRADRVDFYGSFSQSYDRDDDFVFLQERIPNSSSLTSDINLNYRARKEVYDIRAIFTGGHEYDLLEGENEVRLRRFYYDLKHKPKKMSMRLGRQKSSSGGVFSRFDGGNFGVGLNEVLKLNLVTGFPMDTTKLSTYETRKYFLGLNMDIGTFKDSWDFNVFGINQMVEGMIDRQGVGGEVRYFYDRKSIFGYVDYDVFFNELNVFLLSGNLTFIGNITINFSLDYRKSPLLTTSNAIQGQNVDSPEDLKDSFTESEIHKLAQARTATNKSFLFGFSHPVTERLQIAGDVTVTKLTSTSPSGVVGDSVTPVEGTAREFFYNLQLIGNTFFMENDIAILGLRYADATTSNTYSVLVNTRFPYTRNFKINPRMRLDFRHKIKEDRFRVLPSLRMNYRWRKTIWFDTDFRLDWDESLTDKEDSTRSFSLSFSYRVEF